MADGAGGVRAGAESRCTVHAEEIVTAGDQGGVDLPVAADVAVALADETVGGRSRVRGRRPGGERPDAGGSRGGLEGRRVS